MLPPATLGKVRESARAGIPALATSVIPSSSLADVEALDVRAIVAAGEGPGVGLHVPALGTACVRRIAVLDSGVVVVEAAAGGNVAVVAPDGDALRVAEVEAADFVTPRRARVAGETADIVVATPGVVAVACRRLTVGAALRQL